MSSADGIATSLMITLVAERHHTELEARRAGDGREATLGRRHVLLVAPSPSSVEGGAAGDGAQGERGARGGW